MYSSKDILGKLLYKNAKRVTYALWFHWQ